MEPLKVVVVGCGNMGSSHARSYARVKGFALAGLVDRSTDRAGRLASELGSVPVFPSLDAAIASVSPDAVAVCTYPETHHEFAMKSLDAGLHVFVEKPLAGTVRRGGADRCPGCRFGKEGRCRLYFAAPSCLAALHRGGPDARASRS